MLYVWEMLTLINVTVIIVQAVTRDIFTAYYIANPPLIE